MHHFNHMSACFTNKNNDLSGAVKPATKIKIRLCVTAQYACIRPVHASLLSPKTDAAAFLFDQETLRSSFTQLSLC